MAQPQECMYNQNTELFLLKKLYKFHFFYSDSISEISSTSEISGPNVSRYSEVFSRDDEQQRSSGVMLPVAEDHENSICLSYDDTVSNREHLEQLYNIEMYVNENPFIKQF